MTTDDEIGAALAAARLREGTEGPDPYATRIEYLEGARIVVVHLSNRLRLAIPVENLQGLENATAEQLRNHELHGRGYGFGFPDLDADSTLMASSRGFTAAQSGWRGSGRKLTESGQLPARAIQEAHGREMGRRR